MDAGGFRETFRLTPTVTGTTNNGGMSDVLNKLTGAAL